MTGYMWGSPEEWLEWKRTTKELSDTEILNGVIGFLTSDDIQCLFQNEMDTDGYFEPDPEVTP